MQIFVKLPNQRTVNLKVDGPHCPVGAVQRQLQDREGVRASEQRLCFGGRELQRYGNGKMAHRRLSLADHDVQEGSTLHLLFRLPGAALLGKQMKGRAKQGDNQDKYARMQEQDALEQKYLAARNELKHRMEQERANSRVNRLKIQNQWRKIMRLAKVENLRKDIEILSQNHERDVDRKDAIIQMLDRDLEEAEDQFQMSLRAHLENMDRLIDLQDTRLLALEQEFEKELHALENEFGAEKEAIQKQHALEVQELNDIMSAVNTEEQDREAEAKQEHEQGREEIKNKNLEEINMLRIQLDSQIEDLEQKFENAHLNYLQTTDQRTSDFKFYTKKDQELSKDIEVKIRKIERLQSSLSHWRTKYSQNVKECSARNALLTEEKNKIQGHFQQLKLRMNKFREGQAQRLSVLTQNTSSAKTTLETNIQLGERILKLAELARKMETDREKVAPYYVSSSSNAEDEAAEDGGMAVGGAEKGKDDGPQPLAHQSAAVDENSNLVNKWNQLDNFWKKHNKVLLDKLAIERERERLKAENASYQELLKQYIDGVSVNDTVMTNPGNPLFVVNGRVSLNRPMPVRQDQEQLPVVDANHMVGTSRVNTVMPL